MSTRSQLDFGYTDLSGFNKSARIYHHYDGYPEARLLDIYMAILKAHEDYRQGVGFSYRMKDTYPTDLAAFYILAHKTGAGNVEIDENLHGDIEYLYQIWQDPKTDEFHVRILTTHQPEDEPYNQGAWKDFWDDPAIDKMRVEAEGTLEELIVKYCGEDAVTKIKGTNKAE